MKKIKLFHLQLLKSKGHTLQYHSAYTVVSESTCLGLFLDKIEKMGPRASQVA